MKRINCPRCGQVFELPEGKLPPSFPFCGDRCRDIDLYHWLEESYSVPVETNRVIQQSLDERNAGIDPSEETGPPLLN